MPGDVFTAHHIGYFTTNLILEHRRHGTRLKPLNRREGKTPLGGELAADPLHLLVLKSQDEIGLRPSRAVDCSRGMPLPHQLVGAPIERLANLDAKSAHGDRIFFTADEPLGAREIRFAISTFAIGDEKTSAANLITRTADSRIGGAILLSANQLEALVGAQGLEPWTR